MRIRIPRPVNTFLDWAMLNPDVVVGAVWVIAALIAVFTQRAGVAWTVTSVGAAVFLILTHTVGKAARLAEQRDALRYENGALRAEINRLRQGDPTARTAQLYSIGDFGEPT